MADETLSSLTAASTLDGAELYYSVQGAADRKVTGTQIKTWTSTAPTIAGGTHTAITGLGIRSSGAAFDLTLASSEVLTAGRTLSLNVADAARTLTISGTATVSQDYSTGGSPQFTAVNIGHATDTTLARVSAGLISVEGDTVALLTATQTLSNKTLTAPNIGVATGTSLDVSGVLESGANGGTGGQAKLFGSTSGDVTIKVAAAAGTATVFQLPADNGTNAYVLQTNGSGVTSWVALAGGGDMLAANNLSDVAVAATAFANIKQAATESAAGVVELATTGEAEAGTDTTRAITAAGLKAAIVGKHTIYIPASAMTSRTTNGAASGTVEQATNKNMVKSLDFDTTTQEFAQFQVWFPKSWDLGTVTFQPHYSQLTTAAGGVAFGLAGVARSDTDALDVAFGTAVTSVDTAGTANLEYLGPESGAITIAGTPAAGDAVQFQINRTVADAGDTLAQDARLHGIRLFYTTNAMTDD